MIALKNGYKVPMSCLNAIHMNLNDLIKTGDLVSCYELIEKAKNSKHSIWSNECENILKKRALLTPSGLIHDDVAAIVKASLQVDLQGGCLYPISDIIEQ